MKTDVGVRGFFIFFFFFPHCEGAVNASDGERQRLTQVMNDNKLVFRVESIVHPGD